MSEVPGSLTELKIQIGKDIYLHGLEMAYRMTDAYWDDVDQVPDEFYVDTADRWRAKCPDVAETFGRAAERALLELSRDQDGAVLALVSEMIKSATEAAMTGSLARAFYAFAILNGALGADYTNARQYFEALVANGRGE